MAGALQIGRDIVGVAKQTALGAIAANPTYAHGVATGSLPSIAIGQADDPQTSGGRAAPGAYRNRSTRSSSSTRAPGRSRSGSICSPRWATTA